MKQLRILFIIGTILCGLPMMGQTKEKTLEYGGWVEEFVTHTAITNAKLTLLDDKGEVVKETISDERNEQKNGGFTFIVANNHRYTINLLHILKRGHSRKCGKILGKILLIS